MLQPFSPAFKNRKRAACCYRAPVVDRLRRDLQPAVFSQRPFIHPAIVTFFIFSSSVVLCGAIQW